MPIVLLCFIDFMNLNSQLFLRIISLALICLAGASGYVLYSTDRLLSEVTTASLDTLEKTLVLQLYRIDTGNDFPGRYPDLGAWQAAANHTGMCFTIMSVENVSLFRSCYGNPESVHRVPVVFEKLYTRIFDPGAAIVRAVIFKVEPQGSIIMTPNQSLALSTAWDKLVSLVYFVSVIVLAISAMVYMTVRQFLSPVTVIVNGLENLREGQLDYRLPDFKLLEWQKTGSAINALASQQQQLLSDRAALTHSLVNVQEEERLHISRELHDELGQCLAAVNAMAASLVFTAKTKCPELVADGQRIGEVNQQIMHTVRSLLTELRCPDIEENGLLVTLQGLVAEWRRHCHGKIDFNLTMVGQCSELPSPLPITVYRIVQECLSNVIKHANASRVTIAVSIDGKSITVDVTDNGMATEIPQQFPGSSAGVGLQGIKERVSAFNGSFQLNVIAPSGLAVRVSMPYQTQVDTV